MEPVVLVVVLATLAELLIEALKPALEPFVETFDLPQDGRVYLYLSLAMGLLLAVIYRVDLLAALGIGPWTWAGAITTGLFIGRGANFVHDALRRLSGVRG